MSVFFFKQKTAYEMRISDWSSDVCSSDLPVPVDQFRIAVAETYDVIVQPKDDRAYTIFAASMARTGYARGTLAPRDGMQAEIPPMGEPPLLTMSDMGMSMDHGSMAGMDMGNMPGMDHSAKGGGSEGSMSGMDHSKQPGMDMSKMPGMDHSKMPGRR